ncbi:MAG: hypothetical protein HY919_09270 [Elusimicrobia bacterium]|nr:hypothetical protein [Elusimicrobiota bacterium]
MAYLVLAWARVTKMEQNCKSGNCCLSQEKVDSIKTKGSCSSKGIYSGIRIIVFGKNDCEKCKTEFEKLQQYLTGFENKPSVIFYDLDTLDGLTEAAMYVAFDIPTIVIEKNGCEIVRWKSLPSSDELKSLINSEL